MKFKKIFQKLKHQLLIFQKKIENNTKKINSALSNSFGAEQVILEFLKSVNLDKMISAINALDIVDKKSASNINLVVNVLILLRDNKDGKGIEQAISLLKEMNISDIIKTLQPFINLIPYGNQLILVLNFIMKINNLKK